MERTSDRAQGMDQDSPEIPEKELNDFVFAIGKCVQNYGVVECLINELIEVIIQDSLIQHHIIKQPVSKRIEILECLIERDSASIKGHGITLTDLFCDAKSSFQNRNKVAHNPVAIEEKKIGKTSPTVWGINVIRHSNGNKTEEWVDTSKLNAFISESHKLIERFHQLREYYNRSSEKIQEERK